MIDLRFEWPNLADYEPFTRLFKAQPGKVFAAMLDRQARAGLCLTLDDDRLHGRFTDAAVVVSSGVDWLEALDVIAVRTEDGCWRENLVIGGFPVNRWDDAEGKFVPVQIRSYGTYMPDFLFDRPMQYDVSKSILGAIDKSGRIRPPRDVCIIRRDAHQTSSVGGVLIADTAQWRSTFATVLEVGPGVIEPQVGDRILYHPDSTEVLPMESDYYGPDAVFIRIEGIEAVIDEAAGKELAASGRNAS